MKQCLSILFMLIFFCNASAQEKQVFSDEINKDELGNVSDEFQEKFFTAITQRAILNHQKAIDVLNGLIQLSPEEGVLYLEKAKNHFALEQYADAERFYLKALKKLPTATSLEIKLNLLNVYQATQNYEKGLTTARELALEDASYLEVSANILMLMKRPKDALIALDELEKAVGYTQSSERLREVIYIDNQLYKEAVKYYKSKTLKEPENILWYAKLMRFYSLNNQIEKTIEIGEIALKVNPFQPDVLAILSLAYLVEEQVEKAIPLIESSLSHNEVSEQNKVLIIQSFKRYVEENPSYQTELIRILDVAIATGEGNASNEEKGMYLRNKDKAKALESFQLALKDQPGKLPVIKEVISLHLALEQYIEALKVSSEAIEIYPTLSELFLLKAKAEIGLTDFEDAIDSLQEGLDYLFDLPELEKEMYLQLTLAYEGLQMDEKAKEFRMKAEKLYLKKIE